MTPLELEQCILLASNVGGDHWEATRALQEWSVDASILLSVIQTTQHESVFFYCLTSFQRYTNATLQEQTMLWQFLLSDRYTFTAPHVRTKAAVVLAYLLQTAFTSSWQGAFMELQQHAPPDLYFKTLIALMQDDDFDTCGIKHVMRNYNTMQQPEQQEPCITAQLIDTLLTHVARSKNDETLLTLALTVLKHFASWADIVLLIQDSIMSLVFSSLSSPFPGVAAIQFLQELVGRGMEEQRKLVLLQELDLLSRLHAHVNLETVDASPIEVVIEVAKLINATGQELAPMTNDNNNNANMLSSLWPQVMELLFRCLAYDDIDVSGAVLPLASRITSMKDMPASQLLTIMYQQMKYPHDYLFDYEDDDEAEEEVYRAQLRKLYQKLVRVSPDLCLQFTCEALANLPVPLSSCPTSDIEAALRLVHHYSEGIRPAGLKTAMKNETFCALLQALHQSDVTNHPHREVLLLYYDLSVRYYPIFLKQPELLPSVLAALSGEQGLQHAHARVKSRSCYLLLRLVKSVVKVMRPYVETAVNGIQGLLTNPNGYQQLRPDDQLYLFETMGLLLGKTGLAPAEQQASLTKVIAPHIQSMNETLRLENLDPDSCGNALAASIAAIAYLSKGFKDPPVQVQMVLAETVSVTLSVLEALPTNDQVRGKIYILLQRMIQCIGTQVLPTMSRFLLLLIEHCTVDDIQDVAQLLNQLCIKFRAEAIPAIDPALLPFLRKCHQLVPSLGEVATSSDSIPPHLQTEQLSVKKLSFTVLQHIVTYRLSPLLLSPTNAGSLELVLETMSEAAIHVDDPVVKKTCITFFRELVDQWINDSNDGAVRSGFLRFVHEIFVPGMLQCFLSPTFNHEDALEARNVSEFASILLLLKTRGNGQFDQYVVRGALSTAGCPPQVLEAFQQVSTQPEMELCLKETIKAMKEAQSPSS